MNHPASTAGAASSNFQKSVSSYWELCKPRVVMLMMVTALVGELLAQPLSFPWRALIFGNLGIAMSAGSAAAINHLLDRRIDARMARTQTRPIASGRISGNHALVFAAVLGTAGLAILYFGTNPLTAALTLASLMGYAFIYTGFLKRATSQNIVIGGLAGAAPPLLGWTAVTGQIELMPLLLVTIIFVWTPPHFWPLAIHRRKEYEQINMPMLPVTHGVRHTRWQVLFYTVLLVAVSVLPFVAGQSGLIYLAAALVLGGGFLRHAVGMLISNDPTRPMRTFGFSINYLIWLFAALLADSYFTAIAAATAVSF